MLQALVLSERLQIVGAAFDRAREIRYQQKQQQLKELEKRQQSIRLTPVRLLSLELGCDLGMLQHAIHAGLACIRHA